MFEEIAKDVWLIIIDYLGLQDRISLRHTSKHVASKTPISQYYPPMVNMTRLSKEDRPKGCSMPRNCLYTQQDWKDCHKLMDKVPLTGVLCFRNGVAYTFGTTDVSMFDTEGNCLETLPIALPSYPIFSWSDRRFFYFQRQKLITFSLDHPTGTVHEVDPEIKVSSPVVQTRYGTFIFGKDSYLSMRCDSMTPLLREYKYHDDTTFADFTMPWPCSLFIADERMIYIFSEPIASDSVFIFDSKIERIHQQHLIGSVGQRSRASIVIHEGIVFYFGWGPELDPVLYLFRIGAWRWHRYRIILSFLRSSFFTYFSTSNLILSDGFFEIEFPNSSREFIRFTITGTHDPRTEENGFPMKESLWN
eukprot:TRINITY_DN5670_c0_g1_i1.p1 TRINITY_DN5670_c0_g1~~TRINITY_DN5670_c0_g1_i1.p1  ORF type:complete len:361 (+),score=24.25 TRINITY_DN5670_c0_g1_i1:2-1084(+)